MKTLIVYDSVHQGNTKKVAEHMARILNADLVRTEQIVDPNVIIRYDLIGFGSGIYGWRHHQNLLNLINKIPRAIGKKVFIFSTCGAGEEKAIKRYHYELRKILQSKEFRVIDEFSCRGFVTWGPFKLLGGRNKGRPNEQDLKRAEGFASKLKQ